MPLTNTKAAIAVLCNSRSCGKTWLEPAMQRSKNAMLDSLIGTFSIEGLNLTRTEIERARAQLNGTLSVDDALTEVYRELEAHKEAKAALNKS